MGSALSTGFASGAPTRAQGQSAFTDANGNRYDQSDVTGMSDADKWRIFGPPGGMPSAPTIPATQPASPIQPFIPEQAPPMLPMQQGLQMPAGKGAAQGPMMQQQPMQSFGGGKPVDLQALIQSLMQTGLLGGL